MDITETKRKTAKICIISCASKDYQYNRGFFLQIFILFIVYVCVYDVNISEVTGMESSLWHRDIL